MLDLNSIAIGVSPAYSLEVEHPTGPEYALHLQGVASYFQLPIQENTEVKRVTKIGDEFVVDTTDDTLRAKHVIWAVGEFQYPRLNGFDGIELCRHTATIASYQKLEGDDFLIVGGYESGVDAAYHLSNAVSGCDYLTRIVLEKKRVPIQVLLCLLIRWNECGNSGLRTM